MSENVLTELNKMINNNVNDRMDNINTNIINVINNLLGKKNQNQNAIKQLI